MATYIVVMIVLFAVGLGIQSPTRNDAYIREWERHAIQAGAYKPPPKPNETKRIVGILLVLVLMALAMGGYLRH